MITLKKIIEWSKPHAVDGGKITRIYNDELELSIVGGRSGLYGDFIDDFEAAVIDRKSGDFITKFFKPELNDDVIGYMKGDDLVDFANQLFKKGFQVR
jgi:hypothetical protein